jgi:ABC-2 type transport system permease protein
MGVLGNYFASDPGHWFGYISMTKHYQSFTRGVIDSSDVIYFILFITTFLTLTVRRLDSDRLSG